MHEKNISAGVRTTQKKLKIKIGPLFKIILNILWTDWFHHLFRFFFINVSIILKCKKIQFYLPRSTIFPNRFFPRKNDFVEQFHCRLRNWCWHSLMAMLIPFSSDLFTPGFSPTSRLCFRRSVLPISGSK